MIGDVNHYTLIQYYIIYSVCQNNKLLFNFKHCYSASLRSDNHVPCSTSQFKGVNMSHDLTSQVQKVIQFNTASANRLGLSLCILT